MRIVPKFFTRMDASAQRSVLITLALFVLVIAVFIVGKSGGVLNIEAARAALDELSDGPWALVVLIVIFCLAAFLGAPQFGLIAMAVAVFGPMQGAVYSWVATMVSGLVTFWLGRFAGEDTFRRYAGNMANRMSAFIGRNAFVASGVVRNVPTGPFLIVNMAFGISQAKFLHYWAGMAFGIIPKITLVAFAGQSIMAAIGGAPLLAVLAAIAAGGVWIALMLYARRRVRTQTSGFEENSNNLDSSEIDTEVIRTND